MKYNMFENGEIVEVFSYDSDIRGYRNKNPYGILGIVHTSDKKYLRLTIPRNHEYETKEITFSGPDYVIPHGDIDRVMVYGDCFSEEIQEYIGDYLKRRVPTPK